MSKSVLKLEAERIIEALDLLALLAPYGEARIVGSVALDLIVKRDIDVHVLLESTDVWGPSSSVLRQLLNHENVHEVRISGFREKGAIKIAIDAYPEKSGTWSVDLWLTTKPNTTGFSLVEYLQGILSPAHRNAILHIKSHFYQNGLLRDGMSVLIYEAVVEKGIQTVEEFKEFLVENKPSKYSL